MELLITNNPLAKSMLNEKYEVIHINSDLVGVLIYCRNKIHEGHKLLTHPLSGSIKPNENPYKSVILSKKTKETDTQSVKIIEEAIITAKKFPKIHINPQYDEDYRMIDVSLVVRE
ncbi:MAG: GrdX family protein [Oscillospiraceae bacterium]|jgi:hypothetical protein|nr:GrdX family protein [Oscillospiraceae bacterium]